MVGKGFVLHQHFIVENCGDGIRLRAQLPAMNVFYFVKMHRQVFVNLLFGSDDLVIRSVARIFLPDRPTNSE